MKLLKIETKIQVKTRFCYTTNGKNKLSRVTSFRKLINETDLGFTDKNREFIEFANESCDSSSTWLDLKIKEVEQSVEQKKEN